MGMYGALLCMFAGFLSAHDAYHATSRSAEEHDGAGVTQALMVFMSPGLLMLRASRLGEMSLDTFITLVDSVASAALFFFAIFHVRLVLRNHTTLVRDTTKWDCGRRANWCQVFGESAAWWFVPSRRGAGPSVDGVHWPVRAECQSERLCKEMLPNNAMIATVEEDAEKAARAALVSKATTQMPPPTASPPQTATAGHGWDDDFDIDFEELRAQWPSMSMADLREMHEESLVAAAALSL